MGKIEFNYSNQLFLKNVNMVHFFFFFNIYNGRRIRWEKMSRQNGNILLIRDLEKNFWKKKIRRFSDSGLMM